MKTTTVNLSAEINETLAQNALDISALQDETATHYAETNQNAHKISNITGLQTALDSKTAKSSLQTATLLASSWAGTTAPYIYTLTVNGVTATSTQEILPTTDITSNQLSAFINASVIDGGQSTNTITLKAYGTKPTIDIPIRIVLRGDL